MDVIRALLSRHVRIFVIEVTYEGETDYWRSCYTSRALAERDARRFNRICPSIKHKVVLYNDKLFPKDELIYGR